MENYCRGCITRFDDTSLLLQYTEKNRRQFVYATGIQVKRNDEFLFQLCKDCFLSMQASCKFKKKCRGSDKLIKDFMSLRDTEYLDFSTYITSKEVAAEFRCPSDLAGGNSVRQRSNNDVPVSPSPSIMNFMSEILKDDDIEVTEAKIISEVVNEDVDIADDTLDSHWLQDDMSIDTDFQLDLSFSQFATPKSISNYYPPAVTVKGEANTNVCGIDIKLAKALENNKEKCFIDDLLMSPFSNDANRASTPISGNCLNTDKLFSYIENLKTGNGDKERNLEENSKPKRPGKSFKKLVKYKEKMKKHGTNTDTSPEIASPDGEAGHGDYGTEVIEDNLFTKDGGSISTPARESFIVPDQLLEYSDVFETKKVGKETFRRPGKNLKKLAKNEGKMEKVYVDTDTVCSTEKFDDGKDLLNNEICEPVDEDNVSIEDNVLSKDYSPTFLEYLHIYGSKWHCTKCEQVESQSKHLIVHYRKKHKIEIVIKKKYSENCSSCSVCGKQFSHPSNATRHYKTHLKPKDSTECTVCHQKVKSSHALVLHMRSHNQKFYNDNKIKDSKVYKYACSECPYRATTKSNLNIHIKRHGKKFKVFCDLCNKGFYNTSQLAQHIRFHTGQNLYKCKTCGASFVRSDYLTRHIRMHTGERPFSCDLCDETLLSRYDLNKHRELYCKEKESLKKVKDSHQPQSQNT